MFSLIQKNLSLKMMLCIILVLVLSFLGLSLSIVKVQDSLLAEMGGSVDNALKNTGQEARRNFTGMESRVETLLAGMAENASSALSESTRATLESEEKHIGKGMEALLVKNAEAVEFGQPLFHFYMDIQCAI